MGSQEDTKSIEAITSTEDVPDLGKQATTTRERISAYFTIAAAAFGLISDGCKSNYATLSDTTVPLALTIEQRCRPEQPYDHV